MRIVELAAYGMLVKTDKTSTLGLVQSGISRLVFKLCH